MLPMPVVRSKGRIGLLRGAGGAHPSQPWQGGVQRVCAFFQDKAKNIRDIMKYTYTTVICVL